MDDLQETVFNAIERVPPAKGRSSSEVNAHTNDIAWVARRSIAGWMRAYADETFNTAETSNPLLEDAIAALADDIGGVVDPVPGDVPSLRLAKCEVCLAEPGAPCSEGGHRVPPHTDRPTRHVRAGRWSPLTQPYKSYVGKSR